MFLSIPLDNYYRKNALALLSVFGNSFNQETKFQIAENDQRACIVKMQPKSETLNQEHTAAGNFEIQGHKLQSYHKSQRGSIQNPLEMRYSSQCTTVIKKYAETSFFYWLSKSTAKNQHGFIARPINRSLDIAGTY